VPACPSETCDNAKKVWITDRGVLVCPNCKKQWSATTGTVFEYRRKPLHTWFQAIHYVLDSQGGVNVQLFMREVGLGSYHTALDWLFIIYKGMERATMERKGTTGNVIALSIRQDFADLLPYQIKRRLARTGRARSPFCIIVTDNSSRISSFHCQMLPSANIKELDNMLEMTSVHEIVVMKKNLSSSDKIRLRELGHQSYDRHRLHEKEKVYRVTSCLRELKTFFRDTRWKTLRVNHPEQSFIEFQFRRVFQRDTRLSAFNAVLKALLTPEMAEEVNALRKR